MTVHPARLMARALRRRCPHCGGGPLFRRWVSMRPTCPDCGLELDRGEADYFIGGYIVNFVAAEFMIALGALTVILASWPEVPWTGLKWALIGLMIPAPIVTYPWAKTLWLAIDLAFRPATPADFVDPGTQRERRDAEG